MAATFEPIATSTLGSAASSIEFSSIPATYTDLRIVLVGKSDNITSVVRLTFNNNTGSNYSATTLRGTGTTAQSARTTSVTSIYSSSAFTTAQLSMLEVDIFSYAGSTNKTCLLRNSGDQNGSGLVDAAVGLWRNTDAINRIDVIMNGDSFSVGTTATLYGILKA